MAEGIVAAAAQPCVVYHGATITPAAFGASSNDAVEWRRIETLPARSGNSYAAVVIADASLLQAMNLLADVPSDVVIIAADAETESALGERAHFSVADFPTVASRERVLRAACYLSRSRLAASRQRRELAHANRELRELSTIGLALMEERDRDTLLRDIVALGRQQTQSDGAAIFLVDGHDGATPTLRLAVHEFHSLPEIETPVVTIAIDDTSIVGHAAAVKKHIVIDDAYQLPTNADYESNVSFDERYGYRRRSMLIVPMLDHHDHLVGVLALVNRVSDPTAHISTKADADRYVLRYTSREVRLARSLAGQAAVSIENARLYGRIERIFESFVKAAVTAIDNRDPTTAGHSVRVSELTVEIAKAVERDGRGPYRELRFTRPQMRELRYAALLHDFGKLTVHEDVLIKAKKLPPLLWERVNGRFDLIRRTVEVEHLRARLRLAESGSRGIEESEATLANDIEELERFRDIVREANEPHVMPNRTDATLRDIARRTFEGCHGETVSFLTEDELHYLELPKGTLDDRERAEIQSHVVETFRFLDGIPWTDDLKNLPTYAYGHHEKLDGSGYPRCLAGDEIPVQTRMITLADIFDALTASDRPYKRAVPPDRALEIIRAEAKAGLLDQELVRVLMESKVYRKILDVDWHRF